MAQLAAIGAVSLGIAALLGWSVGFIPGTKLVITLTTIALLTSAILWGTRRRNRGAAERTRGDDRFRAAVESAPNGMVMIDRAGGIVLVNREIERLFGNGEEDVQGQTSERMIPRRNKEGERAG